MKGKHGHKKHHRDEGGRVGLVAAGNPDVLKEAKEETSGDTEERKRGGKVKKKELGHAEGKMAKHRRDRARGGSAMHHRRADGGGTKGKDLPPAPIYTGSGARGSDYIKEIVKGRKSGGRVGADKNPLSSAHHGGSTEERANGQPD